MMNITIETLKEHRAELEAKFGKREQIAYRQVSTTQLSVARYYGGATVQGQRYIYNPTDDSLIRADVIKWLSQRLKGKGDE